jgi:hypothetical protein
VKDQNSGMIWKSLIALLAAAPAWANGCHDLWFTRNLVMDRAGYCFGSVLGQAQFDNRDCIGKTVSLTPQWQSFVTYIQGLERQYGCRVDTSQPVLDLWDAPIRRRLQHLPIADEFESACLGWLGPPTPLYSGYDGQSPVVGTITPGSIVGMGHVPVGDWSYVTVSNPNTGPFSGGWYFGVIPVSACADFAG